MKKDMGGAALVLALSHWAMASRLPVRLRALVPAVENSVSGDAYRPLDVLRTRAGITVEQVCVGVWVGVWVGSGRGRSGVLGRVAAFF